MSTLEFIGEMATAGALFCLWFWCRSLERRTERLEGRPW